MAADLTVDLVTVKDYLTYSAKDQDNKNINQEQIEFLITAGSKAFVHLAGRDFLTGQHVYDFAGHGGLVQYLPRTPVTTLTLIEYWNATAWKTADTGTYPRELEPSVNPDHIRMTSASFGRGTQWRVTYTGGYAVAAIPLDIKEAVCQLVMRSIARATGKEGVTAESMQDQSISLDLKLLASDKIKQTADGYRTIVSR